MTKAVRASDTPYAIEVEQGKNYWWRSCGLSDRQPAAMRWCSQNLVDGRAEKSIVFQ